MKLSEIAEAVDGALHGDGSVEIRGVASLEDAEEGTITFLADGRQSCRLSSSRASAFIVPPGVDAGNVPFIVSDNPQLAFAEAVRLFQSPPSRRGIDPGAFIEEGVEIGADVTIYPNVYVGEDVVLGDGVTLYPGVYVGPNSRIGRDSVLYPNVMIGDGTEIGERVVIHGGAVIGADGYGYIWDGERHRKIPQVGKVVIEDDVEIGANCTIDRAALGRTIIRRGTKIDNLVQVAHNCDIGENTLLVAQVGISGSVKVGRRVIMAGQVGVADHLRIGDGAIIGAKSGITKNIGDGAKVSGYPPLPHMEWMRIQKLIEKLPEMRKLLRELLERMERLEAEDARRQ